MSFGGIPPEVEAMLEEATGVVDEQEFLEKVGKLIQESGELLDPEVAALTVLDEFGVAPPAPIVAPDYAKMLPPDELEAGLDGVIVEGRLLGMEPTRTFQRKDGSTGFVTDARIKNDHGVYAVTMWDDHIRELVGVEAGARVRFDGLYTKDRRGEVELHTGRDARVRELDVEPKPADDDGEDETPA